MSPLTRRGRMIVSKASQSTVATSTSPMRATTARTGEPLPARARSIAPLSSGAGASVFRRRDGGGDAAAPAPYGCLAGSWILGDAGTTNAAGLLAALGGPGIRASRAPAL